MKNKLLPIFIIIFITCALMFTLTACGHDHDYTTLKSNELTHWVECECGDKQNVELHDLTYKDYTSYDKVCTVCNYLVPHSHDYTMFRYDTQNHWYQCICGDKNSVEPHSGGNATCEQSAVCYVCGKSYGTAKEHNYANITSLGNGKHIKTCTHDNSHIKTFSCYYQNFVIDNNGMGVGVCDCGDTITEKILNIENNVVTSVTTYGKKLIEIRIPNNVTSIGDYAFYSCDSLRGIDISNALKSLGDLAFYGCGSLKNIEIPNSLTNIGSSVFTQCNSLKFNVKDDIKYLGNNTNPYLYLVDTVGTSIKTANIDKNCKFIADYAFSNCSLLTSIVIPNSVIGIPGGAFNFCSKLTIYCEAQSKPSGWSMYWNSSRQVVWGYKGENS